MFFNEKIIVDSLMSFSDAIEGTVLRRKLSIGYHLLMSCTIHLTEENIRGKLLSTGNGKMMFMKYSTLLKKFYFP